MNVQIKLRDYSESTLMIEIYDVVGNRIDKTIVLSDTNDFKSIFDLSNQPAGTYSVQFKKGTKGYIFQIIKFE